MDFRRVHVLTTAALGMMCMAACRTTADVKQDEQLTEMSRTLKKIQVTRADSDVGVDDVRAEIATLRGAVEEIQHRQKRSEDQMEKLVASIDERLKTFEQRVGDRLNAPEPSRHEEKPPVPAKKEETSGDQFELGAAAVEAKNCPKAIKHLQSFVEAKPTSKNSARAYIMLGDCFLDQKKYPEAVDAFQNLRDKFPKSPRVPTVIYGQAEGFRRMGDNKTAKLFYQELIDKYPAAVESKLAQKKLKTL